MIRFEEMKLDENSPIYMQIIDFIRGGLAAGTIVYGDELPSRRMLSAILGINPNTVQKAYAMLEAGELIRSGVPVMKAAEQAGFEEYSTFLRAFRGTFHMSPREFR